MNAGIAFAASVRLSLAIGTIFAFLDAWNIGANDVANSWATSVGSRSVTLIQAMVLAAIMEFTGAVGVGARITDVIRTGIVETDQFRDNPGLLMLGMTCAVIGSSVWLTIATRIGLPVSTTHSILGGVIGMGVASLGAGGVIWVKEGSGTAVINGGVVQVFLAWIIAPGIAGVFGAILFLITKFGVMLRKDPVKMALFAIPVYFWLTASLICMLLLWKGGSYKIDLTEPELVGTIIGAGAGFAVLASVFVLPWIYRVVVLEDWQLRWYHLPQGPLLLRRGPCPAAGRNYYAGHLTREELEAKRMAHRAPEGDEESASARAGETQAERKVVDSVLDSETHSQEPRNDHPILKKGLVGPQPEGKWFAPPVAFWWVKKLLFNGVDRDVVSMQHKKDLLSGDLEETHARSAHYNNKAEFMYTFLQILTACAASFTHGANDVSNAIGPYSTIYQIWNEGQVPGKKSNVPVWILVFGGAGIALGLWTYGYRIMSNLGNKLTLHSPSRGFSMELGSTVTIIIATRLKLPVSTTQCITGAVVGVGLCNGDWRALNWRMIGWIYGGWVITLPCAGIISGCLMGFIINAPRWGLET
ncbi:phosphate-repressible phosphate permease [Apiospora phragmitis]|uniref:Phosphate transporter n=1 Tax=Apiospora phragmitis TaxID=2905665 RepID=A0ABR1WWG1_9PEZI